jgi:hemerythrin-like domain-containing protein
VTALQPIAPLMIEHRVIERMIRIVKLKHEEFKKKSAPSEAFIDSVVDFIRTYADQTHHGKEEDILFRELKKKQLSAEHKKIMEELIQDHANGRKAIIQLEEAKRRYFSGRKEALSIILEKMEFLVNLYPKHIEKEDQKFFQPVMNYFSSEEQGRMLEEERVFDRKIIHRKYNQIVSDFEESMGVTSVTSKNWLEYL